MKRVTAHDLKIQIGTKNAEVRRQWEKFDKAVAQGITGAPLVQINRKLSRLEHERDELEFELSRRKGTR